MGTRKEIKYTLGNPFSKKGGDGCGPRFPRIGTFREDSDDFE